ncbi:hypothetical protein L6164_018938 [Bauhinia variegata]|uniref:Uncharacterized protein n=1 Tax=Bauhinia variegata TaxID=167791 RepID=A0ACB9NDJ6_BAUVA|nr:hypothetical protein L6164_018938 [Bauhinia variegata]
MNNIEIASIAFIFLDLKCLCCNTSPALFRSVFSEALGGANLNRNLPTMAARSVSRYASRRLFSSGSGRVLSEEEKAAENVYIKKTEQEKLEKLARKGPQPEQKPATGSGVSATDAKSSASSATGTSTEKVSTDKYRNYAVIAGTITAFGALGWYLKGTAKKPDARD